MTYVGTEQTLEHNFQSKSLPKSQICKTPHTHHSIYHSLFTWKALTFKMLQHILQLASLTSHLLKH